MAALPPHIGSPEGRGISWLGRAGVQAPSSPTTLMLIGVKSTLNKADHEPKSARALSVLIRHWRFVGRDGVSAFNEPGRQILRRLRAEGKSQSPGRTADRRRRDNPTILCFVVSPPSSHFFDRCSVPLPVVARLLASAAAAAILSKPCRHEPEAPLMARQQFVAHPFFGFIPVHRLQR